MEDITQQPAQAVPKRLSRRKRMLLLASAAFLVLILVIILWASVLTPRSRADKIVRESAPYIEALNSSLPGVIDISSREAAFYQRSEGGLSPADARAFQDLVTQGSPRMAAALDTTRQVHLLVKGYGDSVSVGVFPVILGGSRVSLAREHLTDTQGQWSDLEHAIFTEVVLLNYSVGMAPILRDFLGYSPAADFGGTFNANTKEINIFRLQRRQDGIDAQITLMSQITTPNEFLAHQERWLKKLVVLRALVADVYLSVDNDTLELADKQLVLYAAQTRDLQEDMYGRLNNYWASSPNRAAIQASLARLQSLLPLLRS
ncbi:MAG: hypothetical protein FJ320_03570 [SAR202 cluster bacterium]|nr:hypothetical protein [SAR202 cluster bacterium]